MKLSKLSLFIGKKIGEGRDRSVYEFKFDPSYVIKVDHSKRFANIIEWDIWNHVSKQLPELAHFYAPCHSISKCGKMLIQVRTHPILKEIELNIPKFMWDNRLCNWGMMGHKAVIHDYSNHTMYKNVDTELVKTIIK